MECLKVLKDEFSTPMIDKQMVSDIVGMTYYARTWASQKVALRNGMTVIDTWVKHYRGVDMPHNLYSVKRA